MGVAVGTGQNSVAQRDSLQSVSLPTRSASQQPGAVHQDVEERLKPWCAPVPAIREAITQPDRHRALALIDREKLQASQSSVITAGARERFWQQIERSSPEMIKAALVASMLCFEGMNSSTRMRESNLYNLPPTPTLLRLLQREDLSPEAKALAVLIMGPKRCGHTEVQALRPLAAEQNISPLLAEALAWLNKELHNALKALP